MRLFNRSYLVRARVALHPPARAAVLLDAAEGRWPEHEVADRYNLAIGFAAIASNKTDDRRWPALRDSLERVAEGIVGAGEGHLPGDLVPLEAFELPGGNLRVVPWEGPGRTEVEVELLKAPGGLVPRLSSDPKSSVPAIELGALATLVALAADGDADRRLELAFGVEGLLAWLREAHRGSPPRNGLAFANAHADERLREIGRTLPES
jgi:hypothetical protein